MSQPSPKPQTEQRERRVLTAELRAGKDKRTIVGHAAVFNSPTDLGWFREQIRPGAFAESVKADDIRALFNHDPNHVLGRNKAGTLRLAEDDKGLAIEIDPPDTQLARDLLVSMERGDVSQMSFGFYVEKQEWDETNPKSPLRTLIKVRLFDVSPVTFPAYEDTDASVRSAFDAYKAQQAPAVLGAVERTRLRLKTRLPVD
jgi:HK97 family phage prohead protease